MAGFGSERVNGSSNLPFYLDKYFAVYLIGRPTQLRKSFFWTCSYCIELTYFFHNLISEPIFSARKGRKQTFFPWGDQGD